MNNLKISQRPAHRIATILAVSALVLGLSACGKKEEPTAAVEKTEQAAAEARAKAASAMENAQTKVEQGAANAESSAKDAANKGMVFLSDAEITAQISASLAKDPDLSAVKIDVDTANGRVTLKGPAPSAVARERAEGIAKAVSGVSSVNNQLVVSAS
ncbi:MAG: transporter [Acidovorax sp. SCN 65-108]|nr:MAG: transporter [Acidovorax sp. SCN 65-108]